MCCSNYFISFQTDKTWGPDEWVLTNVTRLDSGLYQCISTDTETFVDTTGNISVSVNCKNYALMAFVAVTENTVYHHHCPAGAWFQFFHPTVHADLDPVVVTPKDSAVVARGDQLKATCNALSSLPTHTAWFKVTRFSVQQIRLLKLISTY